MKNETAIEVVDPKDIVHRGGSQVVQREPKPVDQVNIESLIRYAIEQKGGVDTLERLMAVRRELNSERSKEEFDRALAAFQAECPVVQKRKQVMNKDNRSVRYRYAPLDDIVLQVKEILQKHGFSYSLDTIIEGPSVKAICKITHSAGHSQLSSFQVPIDKDAYMTNQQQFASALTFAKRYAFCNAFGILTGDEDTDGAGNKEKPQGPSKLAPENPTVRELAAQLWKILEPVRGSERNWDKANDWLWREEILDGAKPEAAPQLSDKRFAEVIEAAKKKLVHVH